MDRHIRKRVSLANPIHFLALGFGSGLAPKAPGTFGTIAAVPLVCLLAYSTTLTGYLLVTLIASVIGIWLCGRTAKDMMVHDDSSIVWDEIAGLLITMIAVPLSWQTLLLGFVLFRIFDILKPWPISYLDARVHGGFGIMIDDILAGLFALILMHITLYFGWL
ncbi:MAG: phosphatidylglycerophosphatase A [Alteromonadaceae bacterium]|jgi:phosphatidylglycerophosphatase A|uniref:Phosphatidylglycerophosphatase A n=2 Tax=Paraglaciecola mesophila TaxID=197222 RepID=K6YJ60_9ALTE|nr:phosphatidylglycerophosphatase A [Paraglaciecola mesophila]MAD16521.1 phosphatidylglycerophosphatase A [Alteromonadaceae bacterium]MBB17967.1 phosphatidylglycerophosphatase A [Rickettsiales bacterium]GAC24026.1 phosphatidylglycerophosphatase A [Paraglaciecola mesophila KMM 241]|tara:strand:+ start:535 stop:1023 length:489 start_codon:yes stop_codon:yes gene_type:complete